MTADRLLAARPDCISLFEIIVLVLKILVVFVFIALDYANHLFQVIRVEMIRIASDSVTEILGLIEIDAKDPSSLREHHPSSSADRAPSPGEMCRA